MNRNIESLILVLGVCGLLFSGYLSAVKLFTSSCAVGVSCPYFLGVPACYYGFVMFLLITVYASLRFVQKDAFEKNARIILLVSGIGTLFSGYFTFLEVPILVQQGIAAYLRELPLCALGFVFFASICALSIWLYQKSA